MAVKVLFLICAFSFSGVYSWTVDLPEVRKYFFEKHGNSEERSRYADNNQRVDNERVFDNINADSPLNSDQKNDLKINHLYDFLGNEANDESDVFNSDKYAGDFGYQTYREKTVHSIVRDGSVYLEGLRRAIEEYGQRLKACERETALAAKSSRANKTWLPENEKPFPLATDTATIDCESVTRGSAHVRRLAELALWATKELQDRAYNDRYHGPSAEEEEKELLLRLAWFLDRLAQLTGFQPKPHNLLNDTPTTTSTTTRTPVTLVPSSQEIVDYLLKCVKRESNEPAPDRCRYPLALPDSVKRIFNATDAPPTTTAQLNNQNPNEIIYLSQHQHPEILVPSETKHIKKRSISDATENPLLYLMQYYAKHKMWENDNPISPPAANDDPISPPAANDDPISPPAANDDPISPPAANDDPISPPAANDDPISPPAANDDPISPPAANDGLFQIKNVNVEIKTLQKRSLANKKGSHFRVPENPTQDISYYLKHKNGIHYVKDETQAHKIRQYLEKIRNNKSIISKNYVKKLEKSLQRPKRSLQYSNKHQPRIPEDPMQDISYYIKNKPGTNKRPNIRQAALYRAGLDQIYRTGNIESIRRYGSNYRPEVPDPFMAAILRSLADV